MLPKTLLLIDVDDIVRNELKLLDKDRLKEWCTDICHVCASKTNLNRLLR